MLIRRLTFTQFLLALAIAGAIIAGVGLTLFVMDQREKSAITAEHVFTALSQGDMSRIIECLKAKPELVNARDNNGHTPLHVAAERDMRDTALLLLNMGADPTLKDPQGKTAADIAKEKGATHVVELLRTR